MGAGQVLDGLLSDRLDFIGGGLLAMAFSASMLVQVTRNFATIPEPKFDE